MNAQTKLSAKGQVVIPQDVRERMHLQTGARFHVIETGGGIFLKPLLPHNPFPRTTTADLDRLPRWPGPPKSIEEISRLSDEVLRRAFAEKDHNACD